MKSPEHTTASLGATSWRERAKHVAKDRYVPASGLRGKQVKAFKGTAQSYTGIIAAALVCIVVLAVFPAATFADSRIGAPGSGPGEISSGYGLAVSEREGGDIYVVDASQNQRIDQFQSNGTFVRAFGWGIIPGAASGTGDLTKGSPGVENVIVSSGEFIVGQTVTGAGIPANTSITAISPSGLTLSNTATASSSGVTLTVSAGPGNVPTNETQVVTVKALSGEFKLQFTNPEPGPSTQTTHTLSANATHGEVQSALEALTNIGPGAVTVTGGPGDAEGTEPYVVEFTGRYADSAVNQLVPVDVSLSGGISPPPIAVETTRQGAAALETCTSVCTAANHEEQNSFSHSPETGSRPGQFNWATEVAINNDATSAEYGDVYVADARNFRVQRFSPSGRFELMFGGEVNKTKVEEGKSVEEQNVCTAEEIEVEHNVCGAGVPGTAHGFFEQVTRGWQSWSQAGANSIAVGPDGTVYVGDYQRVQEFEPDGTYKEELSVPNAQFLSSLAIDSESHVYVGGTGVNERQFVKKPASGTFELCFKAQCTAPLSYYANAGELEAALELLSTVGTGNVHGDLCLVFEPSKELGTCIEFRGSLAETNLPQMTASAGSVVTVVEGAPYRLAELAGPQEAQPSEVLHEYDQGGEPTHLAIDAKGDVFASDINGGHYQFRALKPDGELYAVFESAQVTTAPSGLTSGGPNLYATAGAPEGQHVGLVAEPVSGPPAVEEERATEIEPTTATLRGVVNPKGFDTEYRFQYVDKAHYESDGGFASPHTESTAWHSLGRVAQRDPVQAAIAELDPATVYHYRIVALNHCNEADVSQVCETAGADEIFETLPPVSIRNVTTGEVGSEQVVLKGDLSPDNSLSPTYWTVCIGTEVSAYTLGCVEGSLHISGNDFETIEARFGELRPNTSYHYQLRAENEFTTVGHPEVSPDQSFTTEETLAEEDARMGCSNRTLREENHSLSLSDCRAYEQISAVYKAGSYGTGELLAPSGERVKYTSQGAFAGAEEMHGGNVYVAHRTASGWVTQAALKRPAGINGQPVGPYQFTSELDKWVVPMEEGTNYDQGLYGNLTLTLWYGLVDGSFVQATPTFRSVEAQPEALVEPFSESGQTPDLSTMVLGTPYRLFESDPLSTGNSRLYEVTGAGSPSPSVRLLAELPEEMGEYCGIDRPAALGQASNLVSEDGSRVFFTSPIKLVANGGCNLFAGGNAPNPYEVFVGIGEAAPIEISVPFGCSSPNPCYTAAIREARFFGASPDGSLAWFTTSQPLINADTDTSNDLYLAQIGPQGVTQMIQASAGETISGVHTAGEGAGVVGVTRVAQNGQAAYFVATGVLTTHENSLHQSAQAGADNLYAYDAQSGETKFVTDICSAQEESGSVHDPACPGNLTSGQGPGAHNDSSLWQGADATNHSQLTPDGRHLVFDSWGRLTPGDIDNSVDVYRYDLQTGQLQRISFGHRGNDGNGNDSAFPAEVEPGQGERTAEAMTNDRSRAITDDGSAIVFTTAAPLVSRDANTGVNPGCNGGRAETGCDVYEWEEDGRGTCNEAGGCISLISGGLDPHGDTHAVISASGRDILFNTNQSFAPTDTDGITDAYDARVEGGFRYTPPERPCESAETCHGPASQESLHPSYTSEEFAGPGNAAPHIRCAKGRHRVKRHGKVRCIPQKKHKRHRKHHHRKHRKGKHKHRGKRRAARHHRRGRQ